MILYNARLYRFSFIIALVFAITTAMGTTGSLHAEETEDVFNAGRGGVIAIYGYDPVAYHTENRALLGSSDISARWGGVDWHFNSINNRDLFVSDPTRYAPQYGGFCAFAVARNAIADIDPDAFSIVDDKLYLNFSRSVKRRWDRDRDQNILLGDRNWPELRSMAQ